MLYLIVAITAASFTTLALWLIETGR